MTADVTLRRATLDDAGAIARGVVDGVADYPAFAPPDWTGPSFEEEVAHARADLAQDHVHCIVGERDGEIVGQISVVPAQRAPHPVDDPRLGHLRNLFVARSEWGSGLAARLQQAIMEVSPALGFTELRLYVAEGQARARRFYEREGWRPAGEPYHDPGPGLRMVEYRRTVQAPA